MIEASKHYNYIYAYSGIGSDIKWCGRWSSGKRCLYCKHHAKFSEWSVNWNWHYVLSWVTNSKCKTCRTYSYNTYSYYKRYLGLASGPPTYEDSPRRYYTVGLRENDLRAVLKKGCRKNSKCKCVSIAQRGSWCCPDCHYLLNRLAKHHGLNIHDILITNRQQLKKDILILSLSGTL